VLGCARKFRCTPEELPALLARWQERLAVLGEAADLAALTAERVEAAQQATVNWQNGCPPVAQGGAALWAAKSAR
jgi:DNA repair ATPase RecN